MNFASDNTAPIPPQIMAALARANQGYAMGYGNDPLTARDRKSTRLNSSHLARSRMPSSA